VTVEFIPVPEPAAMALAALAGIVAAAHRRRA
jgi:PEP-CTERM motif